MFPLSYHHHAFYVAQLVPFVYSLNNSYSQVFEYTDWVYSVQGEFQGGASVNMTQVDVIAKLCKDSSAVLSFVEEQACLDEFEMHGHDGDARTSWKFAAYNGVSGTPTVFLNGVEVDAPNSVESWRNLLNPYLQKATTFVESALKVEA